MGDSDVTIKARAEERIGSVLREKWCLDQLLGLGGMAAVYAATHRNGKRAAIKMLHPEAALIPDVRARFLREGYLANKVGHFGAVSILDDDVDEHGNAYLVMELLEGETLEDRWRREERLPWADVLLAADQVLDVLITAHAKHIVHRDLKPGNLFIHADGSVKILDFGIARLGRLQTGIDDTGPHVSLGTPGFMPPEQARGRSAEIDEQSDLWALGATMFALLTGRHVHEAETANEQLLLAMTEAAPPIAEIAREVPPRVAEIVDKALAFTKSDRFADARTMQAAIRECYEALLGEPIHKAGRLAVASVRISRSVQPDAPTLAAEAPRDDRLTTTRPVSDKAEALSPQKSRPIGTWLALGALALGVGIAIAFVSSRTHGDPATAATPLPDPSTAVAPAPEPAPQPEPVATPAPEPSPEASAAPAASSGVGESEKPPAKRPIVQRRAPKPAPAPPPASSPAPAPEVDIFTRRK